MVSLLELCATIKRKLQGDKKGAVLRMGEWEREKPTHTFPIFPLPEGLSSVFQTEFQHDRDGFPPCQDGNIEYSKAAYVLR